MGNFNSRNNFIAFSSYSGMQQDMHGYSNYSLDSYYFIGEGNDYLGRIIVIKVFRFKI